MTEPTLLGNEKYEVRVTRLTILPPSEPIFSERATHIELRDEAAGEFVVQWTTWFSSVRFTAKTNR